VAHARTRPPRPRLGRTERRHGETPLDVSLEGSAAVATADYVEPGIRTGGLLGLRCDRRISVRERPGQLQESASSFGLHVGGVDHSQTATFKPLAGDEVQYLEGGLGGRLVVLVIAHQAPAEIRGDDFGGEEVLRSERRLSRARHPHQCDEAQHWDLDGAQRKNTAICVGEPTSSSIGPIGVNLTS
jgi:hypothetical protein